MRKNAKHEGFTLIETLVTIGIMSFLALAIFSFQKTVLSTSTMLQNSFDIQREVRRGLLGFTAEIRSAQESSGGAYPIESAGTSSLIFFSNTDDDAGIERVRYFIATSTLYRGVIDIPAGTTTYDPATEVVRTLVHDVTNGTSTDLFVYYDGTFAGTSSPSLAPPILIPDIRLIRIQVAVDPNGELPPNELIYSTQATIRNLKDNL